MTPPDLPDPVDIPAWRALLVAAPDRDARQACFAAWAGAAGCTQSTEEGRTHVWSSPDHIDARVAMAMQAWAILSGQHLRPPLGSWAASDARLNPTPEWQSV